MIIGTPDPQCICCNPAIRDTEMPFHVHHDYIRVDVFPQRDESKVCISVGELDLSVAEARQMASYLEEAARVAEQINNMCACGHTVDKHGKYFKQRPCDQCDCMDVVNA